MLSGIAFLILGLLVLAGIGYLVLSEQRQDQARLDRRLNGIAVRAPAAPRLLAPVTVPDMLAPLLAQAQVEFTMRALGIAAGVLLLIVLLALLLAGPVVALLLLIVPPALLLFWIRHRAYQRTSALIEALPHYIDAVRQMQTVGSSLSQAIERALHEAPDIVRSFLGPVARKLELGAPVSDAMQQQADRLHIPEISMLAAAIRTNSRFGGSITTILQNLSNILRERIRIKRDLLAATSEARVSGRVLIAIPFVAVAVLFSLNPTYPAFFIHDPRGHTLALAAVVLQGSGVMVMRRMMRLSF